MSAKVIFTTLDDEKLVEGVSKHPSLFDLQNPFYKDQNVKDNAWKEIGEQLNQSGEDCKKRWRNIKDTYNRRKKKSKSTGSAAYNKNKWPLADMLSFLNTVEHLRPSIANISSNSATENIDSIDEDEIDVMNVSFDSDDAGNGINNVVTPNLNKTSASPLSSSTPRQKKRPKYNDKILTLLEERREERKEILRGITESRPDEIDLFFRSIAMSVKKLKPELINEVKIKTLQLVADKSSSSNSYSEGYHHPSFHYDDIPFNENLTNL